VKQLRAFGLCAVVALSACSVWSKPRPEIQSIIETRPAQVRVTLTDGRQLIVHDPAVRGDSLVGAMMVEGSDDLPSPGAIPLADLRSVSTREFSLGKTAFRVGVVAVAWTAVSFALVYLLFASWHPLG
jgi:hypothetical protein